MEKQVANERWATVCGTIQRDKLLQKVVRWRQKKIKRRYEREIKFRFSDRWTLMETHTHTAYTF